jgi:hypothetical protein
MLGVALLEQHGSSDSDVVSNLQADRLDLSRMGHARATSGGAESDVFDDYADINGLVNSVYFIHVM